MEEQVIMAEVEEVEEGLTMVEVDVTEITEVDIMAESIIEKAIRMQGWSEG